MKNKSTGSIINVTKHIITRNFWEYYVTDDKYSKDIVRALVMGFEIELGDISLSEVAPHAISCTSDLSELAPADGWEWA